MVLVADEIPTFSKPPNPSDVIDIIRGEETWDFQKFL